MTESATASQDAPPDSECWDAFIGWARRFAEWHEFDAWERDYKLEVGANLQAAREAVISGAPDWLDTLKRAFGKPNNLSHWRFNAAFLKWCQAEPREAASALTKLWNPDASVAERIDGFLAIVPKEARTMATAAASFLHMAMDPTQFPVFRLTPVEKVLKLTGHPSAQAMGQGSPGARYEHFLAFLDRVLAEAAIRGLTLRDRLDAQSVAWSITTHLPNDWPEADRRALQAYRGEAAADEPTDVVKPDPPSTWWVNQGGSYTQGRDGGYLWAPLQDKKGLTPKHWKDMERLRPGDVVLHYANSALRAVSEVQAEVVHAPHPAAAADPTAPDGYLVMTEYYEFRSPLPLADIPQEWRQGELGPFTKIGTINQGYLYPVPVLLMARLVERFPDRWPAFVVDAVEGVETGQGENGLVVQPRELDYAAPPFAEIVADIEERGLRIAERTLRRYHLSLATRGFVILAGPSGTGKTWLAQAYADAVGARHALVSVAPNWTTNEDLLGYFNPLSGQYHDTAFSRFLRDAAHAYTQASAAGQTPRPYHLVLDEMNLARVEYYFAAFLSAMEVRARHGTASLALGPEESVLLPPSLSVIGTVNIDETTHGFADKVYDRAQLVELDLRREDLALHMGDAIYREALLNIWDAVADVGPFAFRALDEVAVYVAGAEELDVPWAEAVDEQLVQKVLPKLKGADPAVGTALERFTAVTVDRFPLSHARAAAMLEGFRQHGFASYFH